MHSLPTLLAAALTLALATGAHAADGRKPAPAAAPPAPGIVPPPPPLPENYNPTPAPPPGEAPSVEFEPEVTIVTRGTEVHEEYRLNGQLYMIKVTPKHGKPYYLIDAEGSGQFRRSELEPAIAVPMWVLKRW